MATRPKINKAQVATLARNVARAQAAMRLGKARLVTLFPEVANHLAVALKQTRAHRRNAELACRHVLCAEALIEVLETRAADGRGREGDTEGAIITEYSELVAAKLMAFPKRPAAERRRIQKAYPEVDLTLVQRALARRKLEPEFVAGVLEDPVNYRAFLRIFA